VRRQLLDDSADFGVLSDDALAVLAAFEMFVELGNVARGQVAEDESKACGWASSTSRSDSIVATPQAGQLGPQRVCCLGHPGFDSTDRHAQTPGNLGLSEAVSDQAHHISVDRRELAESLIDGEHRERLINGVVLGRQLEVLNRQQRPGRRPPAMS